MITKASPEYYPATIEVWELSVKATHHFLPEEYLREIKVLLPSILPGVELYTWRDNGEIKGFAGVSGDKIEMLFIHPLNMAQGIGRMFIDFCIHSLKAMKVDVNEQNEAAIKFYQKIGFKQVGRQELDSMERPFPLLHMQYFF